MPNPFQGSTSIAGAIPSLPVLSAAGVKTQYLPSITSGLVAAWDWRASTVSGGKITALTDVSGNGNTLTCASSTYQHTYDVNGAKPSRNGTTSTSNGYALSSPIVLDRRSCTIILIKSNIGADTIQSGTELLLGPGGNYNTAAVYFSNNRVVCPVKAPSDYPGCFDYNLDTITPLAFSLGPTANVMYHRDRAVSNQPLDAGTDTITGLFSTSNASGIIGGNAYGASGGAWQKILIYNRNLSFSEVQQIFADFGIRPRRNIALLTHGTSIDIGTGATNLSTFWGTLVASARGYDMFPMGLPAQQLSVIIAGGNNATVKQALVPGALNVITIGGWTNDLAYNTGAESTLRTNLATYIGWLRAYLAATATVPTRFKILVKTILPRTGGFAGGQNSSGFETDRLAHNAWLRTNYAVIGADGIVDDGDTSTAMGNVANVNTYFTDGIHPNDTGQSILSANTAAAIGRLALDGPSTDTVAPLVARIPLGSNAWTQAVTGSGSTTRNEYTVSVVTGSTSGSTALARCQGPGAVFSYAGTSASNSNGPDWSRKVRFYFTFAGLGSNSGGSTMVARISLGKDSSAGIGDLSARKGVQLRIQGTGSSAQLFLGANNGTTFTESSGLTVDMSSWAPRVGMIESDGLGNVRLYLGLQVLNLAATSLSVTGGPTSIDSGYSLVQVEVSNASTAASHRLDIAIAEVHQF